MTPEQKFMQQTLEIMRLQLEILKIMNTPYVITTDGSLILGTDAPASAVRSE